MIFHDNFIRFKIIFDFLHLWVLIFFYCFLDLKKNFFLPIFHTKFYFCWHLVFFKFFKPTSNQFVGHNIFDDDVEIM
jgi:hypothetical protein